MTVPPEAYPLAWTMTEGSWTLPVCDNCGGHVAECLSTDRLEFNCVYRGYVHLRDGLHNCESEAAQLWAGVGSIGRHRADLHDIATDKVVCKIFRYTRRGLPHDVGFYMRKESS